MPEFLSGDEGDELKCDMNAINENRYTSNMKEDNENIASDSNIYNGNGDTVMDVTFLDWRTDIIDSIDNLKYRLKLLDSTMGIQDTEYQSCTNMDTYTNINELSLLTNESVMTDGDTYIDNYVDNTSKRQPSLIELAKLCQIPDIAAAVDLINRHIPGIWEYSEYTVESLCKLLHDKDVTKLPFDAIWKWHYASPLNNEKKK